jgi:hypothetical protein
VFYEPEGTVPVKKALDVVRDFRNPMFFVLQFEERSIEADRLGVWHR